MKTAELKFGIYMFLGFIAFFFAMKGLGLYTNINLRTPHGPEHLLTMRRELVTWMDERDYDSVQQLRGSVSRANVPDPQMYDRANYFQTIHSWVDSRP